VKGGGIGPPPHHDKEANMLTTRISHLFILLAVVATWMAPISS